MTRLAHVKTSEVSLLNRAECPKPLVSIIVTHHNYSDYLAGALSSVCDQSHADWECIVVDDASDRLHADAAGAIVSAISKTNIKFLPLSENVGQIPAFYAGLAHTTGAFVCLLDPDDRLEPTFLEEALAAHLNPFVYSPILSTEQILVSPEGTALTGIYTGVPLMRLGQGNKWPLPLPSSPQPELLYYSPQKPAPFASTSSLMLRRAALDLLKPPAPLAYKGSADSYFGQGAHQLGGTLFLTKALVRRTAHTSNAWLSSQVLSNTQDRARLDSPHRNNFRLCRTDVITAIKANGGGHLLFAATPAEKSKSGLVRALRRMAFLDPQFIAKWKRSIAKWRANT